MPTYKDSNDNLHFLDSADFAYLLPPGSVEITEAKAEVIRAAQVPVPTPNDLLKQQITALEAQVTERRTREAVLGIDNGWLKGINDQIATLRTQLK